MKGSPELCTLSRIASFLLVFLEYGTLAEDAAVFHIQSMLIKELLCSSFVLDVLYLEL